MRFLPVVLAFVLASTAQAQFKTRPTSGMVTTTTSTTRTTTTSITTTTTTSTTSTTVPAKVISKIHLEYRDMTPGSAYAVDTSTRSGRAKISEITQNNACLAHLAHSLDSADQYPDLLAAIAQGTKDLNASSAELRGMVADNAHEPSLVEYRLVFKNAAGKDFADIEWDNARDPGLFHQCTIDPDTLIHQIPIGVKNVKADLKAKPKRDRGNLIDRFSSAPAKNEDGTGVNAE